MNPKAILTDIEGTTSSIAFVHEVLFPYARTRLASYVAAHPDQVAPVLAEIRAREGALSDADCIARLIGWMDQDAKIGPLKTLQGMIWADGYRDGALKGHIYPDAVAGLRRWHAMGITLAVYSSGSVPAQKLLFGHSEAGDLTPLFSGWFDTGCWRQEGRCLLPRHRRSAGPARTRHPVPLGRSRRTRCRARGGACRHPAGPRRPARQQPLPRHRQLRHHPSA
jgi:2,3-diketo-5-methylthio-1-phosphopentane phosphatase